MRPLLDEAFGNPSSGHWASQPAKAVLDRARAQVAALLAAQPDEIVFTSGGSEANNLALKGSFFALRHRGDHIITQVTEHPAVLKPLAFLEQLGAKVTYLLVDPAGQVDPDAVRRAITPRTVLISVMHANNETGTIQPIEEIGAVAREHGVRFHTDASQSAGKIPTRVGDLRVDLLSIAGHKLYAPKGVGALYVRRDTALEPLVHGAGHEGGRRAGTESALLAVGLGEACTLAQDLAPMERVRALRDRLWQGLQDRFGDQVVLNGHPEKRLPNTLNVCLAGSEPRCWRRSTAWPPPRGRPAIPVAWSSHPCWPPWASPNTRGWARSVSVSADPRREPRSKPSSRSSGRTPLASGALRQAR